MKMLMKVFCLMLLGIGTAWSAVNINTATQSELESVKGLGPTKAKAIIAYREKNGQYKSVDELDQVRGFGKSTIDKLRSELTVESVKKTASAKASEQSSKAPKQQEIDATSEIEEGNEKACIHASLFDFGAPEEIRTPDPLVRSQVLYPAELRARSEGGIIHKFLNYVAPDRTQVYLGRTKF